MGSRERKGKERGPKATVSSWKLFQAPNCTPAPEVTAPLVLGRVREGHFHGGVTLGSKKLLRNPFLTTEAKLPHFPVDSKPQSELRNHCPCFLGSRKGNFFKNGEDF